MNKFMLKIRKFLSKKETDAYYWSTREKSLKSRGLLKYYHQYRHKKLMKAFCAGIALGATIQSPPTFPHGINGIFISNGANIGKNSVIFHQVTIGSNTIKGSKNVGSPTIGDNVYIGCGAKIIGNVKIGNNVRIGANCIVTKDLPDNCTAVMESPRVIIKDTLQDNTFVSWGAFNG